MKIQIIAFVLFLHVTTSLPQGVFIGKDGTVGASFGGYSASAGLGGVAGEKGTRGGLFAQAGTPNGHFASAGLGGSVSENSRPQGYTYSGAGQVAPGASGNAYETGFVGGNPGYNRPQGSKYDNIFNIPIATLNAVNQYLNNRYKDSSSNSSSNHKSEGSSDNSIDQGSQKSRSNFNDIFNVNA